MVIVSRKSKGHDRSHDNKHSPNEQQERTRDGSKERDGRNNLTSLSEEYHYLEDGFTPDKSTIPQLRGILLHAEVEFSWHMKKSNLVVLFNEKVLPTRETRLKKLLQVKPSTDGIIDAHEEEPPRLDRLGPDPLKALKCISGRACLRGAITQL